MAEPNKSAKYKDKYDGVWDQMPISDNVLDLRGRAVEMTQEGRKRYDDMNKPEHFDPPDRDTKLSRDAGVDDVREAAPQPFGTVRYREDRPQSLSSEGAMQDFDYPEDDRVDRAARGEERSEEPYVEGDGGEGEQSFAEGGEVMPEDEDGDVIEGDEEDLVDEPTDEEENDDPEGVMQASYEGEPNAESEAFAENAPLGAEAEESDDDDGDDEAHTLPDYVRATLDYGRAQNGFGGPETDTRGVLPAADLTAALKSATDDPEIAAQQKNAKMTGYLGGKDALSKDEVAQYERKADPSGSMDPDDARLMAIEMARATGGDQAAWGLMQYYRQQFDARRMFAAAAAAGTPDRPADLNASAAAANQAFQYLPDGNKYTFTPTRTGMRVSVARG